MTGVHQRRAWPGVTALVAVSLATLASLALGLLGVMTVLDPLFG